MNLRAKGWALVALVVAASPAHAAGDAAAGKMVFKKCQACHSLEADRTLIGPSLHGIFGRKAGAMPDFRYSASMAKSGIVWDTDTLAQYLPDPQALVPHTKMSFIGLKDPVELDDLIAYLKQATR
ncbi:MAG TPA: cytochrome c family protein [Stellaceae bacterium]|nr:cytochrome c family protein [Stellaceae bacterium]